jgi:hypothetical protein
MTLLAIVDRVFATSFLSALDPTLQPTSESPHYVAYASREEIKAAISAVVPMVALKRSKTGEEVIE